MDAHPVSFTEEGHGAFRLATGEIWLYPAQGFSSSGRVLGTAVPCIDAETEVLTRTGYVLRACDRRDLAALHERFGVPLRED